MLKLQSTLKESAQTMFEDATHYEVVFNEQRIGTFTLYFKTKADHEDLCGWADQYHGDYYWGDKDEMLRLILSTQLTEREPQSFILISDLAWEIPTSELFVKSKDDFSIADQFIGQLEALRVKHRADVCYIPLKHQNPMYSQWEIVLKGLGYEGVAQTDLEVFYVSAYHVCEECCEWIPIEDILCPTCDYQERMDMMDFEEGMNQLAE